MLATISAHYCLEVGSLNLKLIILARLVSELSFPTAGVIGYEVMPSLLHLSFLEGYSNLLNHLLGPVFENSVSISPRLGLNSQSLHLHPYNAGDSRYIPSHTDKILQFEKVLLV